MSVMQGIEAAVAKPHLHRLTFLAFRASFAAFRLTLSFLVKAGFSPACRSAPGLKYRCVTVLARISLLAVLRLEQRDRLAQQVRD